jgi:hypothetical protein
MKPNRRTLLASAGAMIGDIETVIYPSASEVIKRRGWTIRAAYVERGELHVIWERVSDAE